MLSISCIGSRDLTKEELQICENFGRAMVSTGYRIVSGNARGADQAFARGANTVDSAKVTLVLPWRTYEEHAIAKGNEVVVFDPVKNENWLKIASEIHPVWYKLSQAGHKLMARNIGIIDRGKDLVIAFPKKNRFGQLGGTGQGIRYAEKLGIKVIRLDQI